jgi:hypothetical protein
MRGTVQLVRALVAVLVFAVAIPSTWAADDTTGKVTIEVMSVAAGLGVSWGEGVLEYRGEKHPFTVTGFSIGDVGVAKVLARGEVYNLKSVDQFAGVFMAAVAGGSLGGGAGAAAMKNQHGANMVWTSTNQGLNFSLAQAGITVKLAGEGQYQAAKNGRRADVQPAAAPQSSR